jgi:hypothetical protein
LLTAAEFTVVLETMLNRYRNAAPDELLRVPNTLSLLYAWRQGAANDEVREWVARVIETDAGAGFLRLLSRIRSWRSSNDLVYYPLKRDDLQNFLDFDHAVRRLNEIEGRPDVTPEDRQLATELLRAIDQGRNDP